MTSKLDEDLTAIQARMAAAQEFAQKIISTSGIGVELSEAVAVFELAITMMKDHMRQVRDAEMIAQQEAHTKRLLEEQRAAGKISTDLIDEYAALNKKSPKERSAFLDKLTLEQLVELSAPYEPYNGAFCAEPTVDPDEATADKLGLPYPLTVRHNPEEPNLLTFEFDGPIPDELLAGPSDEEISDEYAKALIARFKAGLVD